MPPVNKWHFTYKRDDRIYIISIAFTKKVQTKGRIRVKYSNLRAIAAIKAAVERRNRSQYIPVYFFDCSMLLYFFVCSML